MKGSHPVTSGLVAGRGDDAFFFYVGLGFRTAAPGVHSSVVNAEDHTVPEALATRHRALGRDGKRERERRLIGKARFTLLPTQDLQKYTY